MFELKEYVKIFFSVLLVLGAFVAILGSVIYLAHNGHPIIGGGVLIVSLALLITTYIYTESRL